MAIKRKRKWVWLSPANKHTFSVKAWNANAESDWASVTLNLSNLPDLKWIGAAELKARPIYWHRCIRVIWAQFPPRYRKWFSHYALFRKEDTAPDNATYADVDQYKEESQYFLASTFQNKKKFFKSKNPYLSVYNNQGTAWNNFYFDHDIEEEKVYHYWVYAVDQNGRYSDLLGPDMAEWGKPQTPRITQAATQVHDVNKWWADVWLEWDTGPNTSQPFGAEYYLVERRQKRASYFANRLWSPALRVEHDYKDGTTKGRYQSCILYNFIVDKEYEFRVRAVNIPGIGPNALVSEWSDDVYGPFYYKIEHDIVPPDEVTGVAANRFFWRGFQKGDYVRLRWDRYWQNDNEGLVRSPVLTEQVAFWNIYRRKGTDTEAQALATSINLHAGYAQDATWDGDHDSDETLLKRVDVLERTGKFEGTQYVDDDINDTSTGGGSALLEIASIDFETGAYIVKDGGTPVLGTLVAPAVVSSDRGHDSTYSLKCTGNVGFPYAYWNDTNHVFFDLNEGFLSFYFYCGNLHLTSDQYRQLVSLRGPNTPLAHYIKVQYTENSISHRLQIALWRQIIGGEIRTSYENPTYFDLSISNNTWVHVECRWKAGTTDGVMQIRVNGSEWQGLDNYNIPASDRLSEKVEVGLATFDTDTYYFDDVDIYENFEGIAVNPEVKYHYYVTAVDAYGYESDVTYGGTSYDSVSFTKPDAPAWVNPYRNFMTFIGFSLRSLKLQWPRIDEATHYQVRIQTQRPGERPALLGGGEYPKSPWHYSPLLREERMLTSNEAGDEDIDETLAEYIYPMPLTKNTRVWGEVSCWNRAGRSDWVSTGLVIMDTDDEPPGNVEFFTGDCQGMNPWFGPWGKVWMGVNLKWQPRPTYEGVQNYKIEYLDPTTGLWTDAGYPPHRTILSSHNFPLIRAHYYVPGNLPLPQDVDSIDFRIRAEVSEDEYSGWTQITVNFAVWWNFFA